MLESILQFDTDLFLFLNEINSPFWDAIMYWISHKFFWIPFYGFLVFLLYKKYGLQKAIVLTLLILVTFALCNTLSVEAFKNVFHRLRPCHNEEISGLVHLVNDHCGGQWGFVSSHATNVFGLATITSFFLSKKIKYFSVLIFFWAGLVSYSRIYLGVHYPLDITCGALLGISIGSLVYGISILAGLKLK
ncbi:MAG: phosphatase PAP2 family protein [Flavobacteriales bacterium]|jgi:undecaprenyl-diphosphatase|tara:strand:- start:174 stop:743 length:570 start_codon:yes stop_codon:yes gene_type:complete